MDQQHDGVETKQYFPSISITFAWIDIPCNWYCMQYQLNG